MADGATPLESQISAIVSGLLATATRRVRMRQNSMKQTLETSTASKRQQDGEPTNVQTLLKLAEQHKSASLVRSFLSSLVESTSNLSVVVAGRPLHQWLTWANSEVDNFDPVGRGMEEVFGEVARTLASSKHVRD